MRSANPNGNNNHDLERDETEDLNYEKVTDFKYFRATLSTKNDCRSKEIIRRIQINKAQKAFYSLTTFFTSKILCRKTKVRLYVTIIRPALANGWTNLDDD